MLDPEQRLPGQLLPNPQDSLTPEAPDEEEDEINANDFSGEEAPRVKFYK